MIIYSSVIAPWNNLVPVLESRFRKISKLFNFIALNRVVRSGVNDPELKNHVNRFYTTENSQNKYLRGRLAPAFQAV